MEKIFGIRSVIIAFLLFPAVLQLSGQTTYDHISKGNRHYRAGDYLSAEEQYRKAREKDSGFPAVFNLADALYQQERYDEAAEYFEKAIDQSETDADKASCLYNLGNTYFKNQEFEKAVEAYKKSIRLNPERNEPRYNLAITKEVMKQMKEQQQQDNQNQQDDGQQEESEKQQEGQKEEQQDQQQSQDGEEEDSRSNEEQDSLQNNESSSFDTSRLDKQTLDSMEAIKLLQIIQSEEQKVQEKLRKYKSNRKNPKKDW